MFDVGGGELLLIVLVILLLFGPHKIPEVAQMVGKGMRKVRDAQDEFTQHIRDLSTDVEKASGIQEIQQSVSALDSVVDQSAIQSPAPVLTEHTQQPLELPPSSVTNADGNQHQASPEQASTNGEAPQPAVVIKPAEGSVQR